MGFMERKLKYVARCLDVEVASDGATEDEAVAAMKEALELFFEDHSGTLSRLPPRIYQFGEVLVHASILRQSGLDISKFY